MTYKNHFLKNLLEYIFYRYCHTNDNSIFDEIFNLIPFGDGISDYIVIPEYYDNNRYFELKYLNDDNYMKSINDKIFKFLDVITTNNNISKSFYVFLRNIQYNFVDIIDIDKVSYIEKKDENNINSKLFSIRDACIQEKNNEYKVLKDDLLYVCSSKIFCNENVLLISKKIIFEELKQYVNDMLQNKPQNFDEEVFYEFLKLLKF